MIKYIMQDCNSDCGCGCGEGHGCDCEGQDIITLTLDDGKDLECVILSIFPAGEKEYIALLPTQNDEENEGEVFLYRYEESEDGQPKLTNIEDDDEYEVVADAFDELLDEMEYDEIVTEDDVDDEEDEEDLPK